MNRAEAKRRCFLQIATLLDGHENAFLTQDDQGQDLPEKDQERMEAAYQEILTELYRRSGTDQLEWGPLEDSSPEGAHTVG